jgi:putative membrane protein
MWGYMSDGGYGWWWGFGALHMLLFWAVLIFVIVVLVRWITNMPGRNSESSAGRAIEILKERYARGEINKEEFEQKKRDLSG